MVPVRHEVVPFLIAAIAVGGLAALLGRLGGLHTSTAASIAGLLTVLLAGYFLYFFRNPPRTPPTDPDAILAGADGRIARITELAPARFRELATAAGLDPTQLDRLATEPTLRISIFLSLFDVHVNRAPIAGQSRFLGYVPGRHLFTFQEKSSDLNQHNSILIRNDTTQCLINQIVGPVCRRVVYWPDPDRSVAVRTGEPIGMMKFGSRLDMYFPSADVRIETAHGDTVRAGESIIARLKRGTPA